MMLVYLTTGECVELTLADSAQQDEEWLTCVDADGRTVAAFAVGAVDGFTTERPTTAREAAREEVSAPIA